MDWDKIQNFSSNSVFAILLVTMIFYWINLILLKKSSLVFQICQFNVKCANFLVFFILSSRWIVAGYFPLSNLYESLLFLTWVLLTLYVYVESKIKTKLVGSVLIPIILLINGFTNLTLSPEMQKASPLIPALQSNWLMLHVSMMLLSYATLIIGSLLCVLFLVISSYTDIDLIMLENSSFKFSNIIAKYAEIQSVISSTEISNLGKLKLLQSIDNWSYRIIGLGFPFLTLGIISGGVWANEAWGSYWSWDPKETWALITWLIFATYLHARITKGWVGKRTAIIGTLGFFSIWICYLGVNFLGKGLHSYGWIS